jgi:D-beta-D-heptose 7-phosphate kinase/D-beta-D-heptose 1-phosphate adenosyltransferase
MITDRYSGARIGIVGDIILDTYKYFRTVRPCPEDSSVNILSRTKTEHELGGAAHVYQQLVAMDVDTKLVGCVGEDKSAEHIENLFLKTGQSKVWKYVDHSNTTEKIRYVIDGKFVFREDLDALGMVHVEIAQFHDLLKSAFGDCHVIIISDYNKGFCSHEICRTVIEFAQKNKIKVVVDPKGINWEKYQNADVICPNLNEWESSGSQFKSIDVPYLLRKCGKDGCYFESSTQKIHSKTQVKNLVNVNGAGDIVVAVLAAEIAIDGLHEENIPMILDRCMNVAALACEKYGTSIVYPFEFRPKENSSWQDKVLQWKSSEKTISVVNGCFDLIHPGHISLFKTASLKTDKLIVAINSDKSVIELKGSCLITQKDRAMMIAAIKDVDVVIVFDTEKELDQILATIKPDFLVKGSEYRCQKITGLDHVGELTLVDMEPYSSTDLKEKYNVNLPVS